MSETPVEYKVKRPPKPTQDRVLSTPYCQTVIRIAEAALVGNYLTSVDPLDYAITFTDRLIKEVGEKL